MHTLKKSVPVLTIGALGVVFGDIGTSPLYALHVLFGPHFSLAVNQLNIYGIISLIFWSLLLVVSCKYIGLVMRADNQGEGGIMALVTLIKGGHLSMRKKLFFVFLGIIGVSLFYGDSAITPAISVLSAVEGLKVITPSLDSFIVPIALVVLAGLFWIQKRGTGAIGGLFGPIMLLWFAAIGTAGLRQVLLHPEMFHALSPTAAISFIQAQPLTAFLAMGAVVLVITGAEALYADMGHFGHRPIALAWFLVVFPALTLCYMGQGALLLNGVSTSSNHFFLLFPSQFHIPVLLLATLATLIASQSVISGAFSLTRQAIQLDLLPKIFVRHTSTHEVGQIYIPFVNVLLFVVVVLTVLIFGSSQGLANAYGVAVSGTLAIDTILFLVVMATLWKRPVYQTVLVGLMFLTIDLLFLGSNLGKILTGGWVTLFIASVVLVVIYTWLDGQEIVTKERRAMEGSLKSFIEKVRHAHPPIKRLPGQAVYIGHHEQYAPLALHATLEELHELHEKVVIVTVRTLDLAHVPEEKRATFDDLGYQDGISHLVLTYGFKDSHNISRTLASLRGMSKELDFDPEQASYFISLSKVMPSHKHNMPQWEKHLYTLMSQNALSVSDYYKLPVEKTIEMRTIIEL